MQDAFVFWSKCSNIISNPCRSYYIHIPSKVHYPSSHNDSRPPNVFLAIKILYEVDGACIQPYPEVNSVLFCSLCHIVFVQVLVHLQCKEKRLLRTVAKTYGHSITSRKY